VAARKAVPIHDICPGMILLFCPCKLSVPLASAPLPPTLPLHHCPHPAPCPCPCACLCLGPSAREASPVVLPGSSLFMTMYTVGSESRAKGQLHSWPSQQTCEKRGQMEWGMLGRRQASSGGLTFTRKGAVADAQWQGSSWLGNSGKGTAAREKPAGVEGRRRGGWEVCGQGPLPAAAPAPTRSPTGRRVTRPEGRSTLAVWPLNCRSSRRGPVLRLEDTVWGCSRGPPASPGNTWREGDKKKGKISQGMRG